MFVVCLLPSLSVHSPDCKFRYSADHPVLFEKLNFGIDMSSRGKELCIEVAVCHVILTWSTVFKLWEEDLSVRVRSSLFGIVFMFDPYCFLACAGSCNSWTKRSWQKYTAEAAYCWHRASKSSMLSMLVPAQSVSNYHETVSLTVKQVVPRILL